MKEIFSLGAKQFLKLIVINIMCFFMVISFNTIGTAIFTDNIGYIAYGTLEEGGESVELYRHYNADGDDTRLAEYEEKGYAVNKVSILSEISPKAVNGLLITIQIFCLILLIGFIHSPMWQIGTKDSNLVAYKHKSEDNLKGFKVGLISIVPAVILLIVLVAGRNNYTADFSVALYKFINSSIYSFIDFSTKTAKTFGGLNFANIVLLFALQLIYPICSGVSYLLGYKNISIGEKLVYKKK